jgi:hypothetical protein
VTQVERLAPGERNAARLRSDRASGDEGNADQADRSGHRHGYAPPEGDIKHGCSLSSD